MSLSLRSRIALALIKKKLPHMMSADPIADLPDGLHVAVVGSGSPLPDVKRGNSCAAVMVKGKVWIVDAGEGSSETLNRMQIFPGKIEGVLMTHYHSDHIGGLASVNLQRWIAEETTTPMRVIGPPGVDRVVNGLNDAYLLDGGYRTAHHGAEIADPALHQMAAETFEIPEGQESLVVLEDDGLKVTAFVVDHTPVEPALGYRFDYKDRSVVISGDTIYKQSLIDASKGADLLIHDALSVELLTEVAKAAAGAGRKARSQILLDVLDYHASAPQAADAAREAGVGALALTHVIPPLPLKGLEGVYLADAPERFKGPLWIARDGDLYSLPPGGSSVDRSSMFGRGPGR